MLKRIPIFFLSLIIAFNTYAQRSSKWGIEIRPFFYTDNYGIETYNWPHLFADGYAPLVDKNNLEFGNGPKGGSFSIGIDGAGARLDVVRHLFPIAGSDNNRVDLSLGVGYKSYKTKKYFSPQYYYPKDTTIRYQYNDLRLRYNQRYADLQTRAIYKIMGAKSNTGFYFGFALQMSLALGGNIHEEFRNVEEWWNPPPASVGWSSTDHGFSYNNAPAKKINYFSWSIPVGVITKVSDHISLLPEFSYTHNTNRKYYYPDNYEGKRKSFSQGCYISFAVRYDF
ncbi:hypothetical protein [Niastella sp. OAS944]|uniref:hypothetical protein n=1 Tax=Niastella sp. OAS944 TaxID=2664089 RepID=UPI00348F58D5|nr:hypothetical protein [Chitinophagaceae bacterium OAS944]